jgi:hypothetical protein
MSDGPSSAPFRACPIATMIRSQVSAPSMSHLRRISSTFSPLRCAAYLGRETEIRTKAPSTRGSKPSRSRSPK